MLLKDVADIIFSFPQKSKVTLENNWLWLSSICLQEDNRIFEPQEENNFIPDDKLTAKEMYEASSAYWNPIFKEEDLCKAEYLFQGKVKVLEEINK